MQTFDKQHQLKTLGQHITNRMTQSRREKQKIEWSYRHATPQEDSNMFKDFAMQSVHSSDEVW